MSDPVPVQPATLEYSGPDAALGPPIRHPGMELSTPPEELRRLVRQALCGGFYAASFILVLAALSDLGCPEYSHLRLSRPVLPLVGVFMVGAAAKRLSVEHAHRGWPIGLWLGALLVLGTYGMYLMAIGYLDWVCALL